MVLVLLLNNKHKIINMILYTEQQLEEAWRDNCKARAGLNLPWVTIEDYRPLYEKEMEKFMLGEFE